MQSSGSAAVRQWPTLSFTHWTCKFDLTSEFIRLEMEMPPPPNTHMHVAMQPCIQPQSQGLLGGHSNSHVVSGHFGSIDR